MTFDKLLKTIPADSIKSAVKNTCCASLSVEKIDRAWRLFTSEDGMSGSDPGISGIYPGWGIEFRKRNSESDWLPEKWVPVISDGNDDDLLSATGCRSALEFHGVDVIIPASLNQVHAMALIFYSVWWGAL